MAVEGPVTGNRSKESFEVRLDWCSDGQDQMQRWGGGMGRGTR